MGRRQNIVQSKVMFRANLQVHKWCSPPVFYTFCIHFSYIFMYIWRKLGNLQIMLLVSLYGSISSIMVWWWFEFEVETSCHKKTIYKWVCCECECL